MPKICGHTRHKGLEVLTRILLEGLSPVTCGLFISARVAFNCQGYFLINLKVAVGSGSPANTSYPDESALVLHCGTESCSKASTVNMEAMNRRHL